MSSYNFLKHTSADEAPKAHALAKAAVEGNHTAESLFRPDPVVGGEFGADFGAHCGEVVMSKRGGTEVEDKVGESDCGGLDGCEGHDCQAFGNQVYGAEGGILVAVGMIDGPLDVVTLIGVRKVGEGAVKLDDHLLLIVRNWSVEALFNERNNVRCTIEVAPVVEDVD